MFAKRQNLEIKCLEKAKVRNSGVWKKPKFRIPMFGKSQNLELQCMEKPKFRILMFVKRQI